MKVSIEFEEPFLAPLSRPQYRCAIAKIRYPDKSHSFVIYIKPVVLGTEPPDVTAYKAAHDDFPHQSTANQWFDESQTESYRLLGFHTIQDIFESWDSTEKFDGLINNACDHLECNPLCRPAALAAAAAASGG